MPTNPLLPPGLTGVRRLCAFAFLLAPACAAPAQSLLLGVSEGTSGGLDHARAVAKYQGLADVIGRAVKRKVDVVFMREFSNLESGMKEQRLDFVMARPSDYPARGIRENGYRCVASAKPDGQCLIVATKGTAIKSVADLKGKRIVLPEPAAYMTKFCLAELRDQGIAASSASIQFVREQGAVTFYLQNRFADAGGIASYSGPAAKWEKDGNVVVHRSRPQPYFPLIARGSTTDAQVAGIQSALRELPATEAGRAVLASIGIAEFDFSSAARLVELLKWLPKDGG